MFTARSASPFLLLAAFLAFQPAPARGQDGDLLGKYKWEGVPFQSKRDRLVFYYFGASDCGPCNQAENIKAIRQVKDQLAKRYPEYVTKCVGVSFDTDFHAGATFLKKYGPWDEISIGSGFYNELWLRSARTTSIPGIPHVLVFLDEDGYSQQRSHYTASRLLVGEYVGLLEVQHWIARALPLWRLEVESLEQNKTGSAAVNPFVGTWKSKKADQPFGIAETELQIQQTASGELRGSIRSAGDEAETQCMEVKLLTPQRLRIKCFPGSTVSSDCFLSLDGESLFLKPETARGQGVLFRRVQTASPIENVGEK
jgi:hypothetical protein